MAERPAAGLARLARLSRRRAGGRGIALTLITLGALTACRPRTTPVVQIGWDFEDGLEGWTVQGLDPGALPIVDRAILASRAADEAMLGQLQTLGGDYWDVPYPIGIEGRGWIGTGEGPAGDAAVGTLTSPAFVLERRWVDFLLGGGCDPGEVGLRAEVRQDDGTWTEVGSATGDCEPSGRPVELLERRVLDLAAWRDETVRLVVYDAGASAHVSIDDVRVTSDPVDAAPRTAWGLADTHTHPMAHLAYGGLFVWGEPTGTLPTETQPDHGETGSQAAAFSIAVLEGDLNQNDWGAVLEGVSVGSPDHTRKLGAPVFNYVDWRNTTHQQMHRDWVRRAYDGGLRLLVAEAVNNRLLDFIARNPLEAPDTDRESYLDQIAATTAFVADNADWMEIALTPAHAREIIDDNRLAVVLGIELDSFGDCDRTTKEYGEVTVASVGHLSATTFVADTGRCADADIIEARVEEVYQLGVRQIHPVHITDNQFGGAAIYQDLFASANYFINGTPFQITPVTAANDAGVSYLFGDVFVLVNSPFMPAPAPVPPLLAYPQLGGPGVTGLVNARGLDLPGRQLVRHMQRRGMMVAVDHMSQRTLDEVIGTSNPVTGTTPAGVIGPTDECLDVDDERIREACLTLDTWPVAMTHTGFRELAAPNQPAAEILKRRDQLVRVFETGGIVSPGITARGVRPVGDVADIADTPVANTCEGTSRSYAQQLQYVEHIWRDVMSRNPLELGVPLGSDFNGLNGSVPPRFGALACGGPARMPDPAQPGLQLAGDAVSYAHYGPGQPFSLSAAPPLTADLTFGVRRFDINTDGVAHYGMLPDFLQDLRTVGVEPEQMQYLFLGAEAYIRAWEKACAKATPGVSAPGCG